MAENIIKNHRQKLGNTRRKVKSAFNNFLESFGEIDAKLDYGLPTQYIPHTLFLAMLGIFYIANTHQAEKMVRKISKLETEVENARADYTTLKVEFMSLGKQSEIKKRGQIIDLSQEQGVVQKITITPTSK